MGSCISTPQRIRRGEVFAFIKMVGFRIILLFALLTFALSMPQEDMNMKVYRQCKKIYGIKPAKSCKTNRDCKVHINGNVKMCPEHDCLKDSNGKMKCSCKSSENSLTNTRNMFSGLQSYQMSSNLKI